MPIFSGLGQPAEALLPVMDFNVIGQQQFAQRILRVWQTLRRLFKPIPRLHPVRREQWAVPVHPAQQKLGVGIAILRLCSEPFHPFITQVEWNTVVTDHRPELSAGFAVLENIVRLIMLHHVPILKGEVFQPERCLNDGIVDGTELLLLGQRHTLHWFS